MTDLEIALVVPGDAAAFVDGLSHDDVGELIATRGEEVIGGLYVECGRICWVAAKGRGRHLSDYLAAAAGVEPSALSRHFHRCREAKIPLGEDLVRRAIVTPDALRRALLLHSVECLDILCGSDVSARWRPRRSGYSSDFTFSTAELVSRAHALRCPEVAAAAASVMKRHFRAEAGEWGAAFLRRPDGGAPVSIAVIGAYPEKATALATEAEVSASVLEALLAVRKPASHRVADGERTRCAFYEGDCMYLGGLRRSGERPEGVEHLTAERIVPNDLQPHQR